MRLLCAVILALGVAAQDGVATMRKPERYRQNKPERHTEEHPDRPHKNAIPKQHRKEKRSDAMKKELKEARRQNRMGHYGKELGRYTKDKPKKNTKEAPKWHRAVSYMKDASRRYRTASYMKDAPRRYRAASYKKEAPGRSRRRKASHKKEAPKRFPQASYKKEVLTQNRKSKTDIKPRGMGLITKEELGTCNFGNLTWSMFIDGEFAQNGPNAFGKSYVTAMLAAWDRLQEPDWKLEVEDVIDLHKRACNQKGIVLRGAFDHVMIENEPCTRALPSETLETLIQDLPADVIDAHRLTNGTVEWVGVRQHISSTEVKSLLRVIIETYAANQQMKSKQRALAIFFRSLAWLHPFQDCNGRVRTLLLQRELQRLRLGCGAFMYNNNANVYYATTDEFERLLGEGMAMADDGLRAGTNPWSLPQEKARHLATFPVRAALQVEDCEGKYLGTKKSISLLVGVSARGELQKKEAPNL